MRGLKFQGFILLFISQFFAGQVWAQDDAAESMQRAAKAAALVENLYEPGNPGASYLISQGGKVLASGGVGMANVEWGIAMTDTTVSRLGSMSKSLTAIAVLQLVEQGKIDLDVPISQYATELPSYMRAVSTRQLLSHRSGLPDHAFDEGLIPLIWTPMTTAEIIDFQKDKAPDFEPGTQYEYVNFNYVVIAHLIEQITGRSFIEFANEEIFRSNGMTASAYDQPTAIIPQRAESYDHRDGVKHSADLDLSHVSAAGALLSSSSEMAHWFNRLVDGDIVSAETLQIAWTPEPLPDETATQYGLGFNISEIEGERYIWHTGLTPGAQGAFGYLPDSELFVIVLSNEFTWPAPTGALVDDMIKVMLGKESE
ncbi:MAG: serine hydrolase domain-containing protein [bacterium]